MVSIPFALRASVLGHLSVGFTSRRTARDPDRRLLFCATGGDRSEGFPCLRNTHTVTLYRATEETGIYSHHSHIVQFEGVVYAAWSNHLKDEDAPGQRVLLRRSIDQGSTWTAFVELFPPLDRFDPASEDGTWCKLYRDLGGSSCKYVSFSQDGGVTRTTATRTDFSDANSRSTAGVLPNGRVYVISNVLPHGRNPLAVSLSEDGLTFDETALIRNDALPVRFDGRWKDTGFQYPSSTVVGDSLCVMYSVNKEDIQMTRIPLSELRSLTSCSQQHAQGDAVNRAPSLGVR